MFQGPGKEYIIPDVDPEDLTRNRLQELEKEIEAVTPESPQMPYDPIGVPLILIPLTVQPAKSWRKTTLKVFGNSS
jgi:hypothetical protein